MSCSLVLRRVAGVLALLLFAFGAGPLVGVAAAATPQLLSTTPANNRSVRPLTTISATFSLTLAAAPASHITVQKEGQAQNDPDTPMSGTSSVTNNTITWTTGSALAAGTYTATYRAQDAATAADSPTGAANGTWIFHVDDQAPVLTLLTLTDPVHSGNSGSATLTGSTSEAATITVSVNDNDNATAAVAAAPVAVAAGAFSVALPSLATLTDGQITATVTAVDQATNSRTGTDDALLDDTGPVLLARDPIADARVAPRSTVSLTFHEPVATGTAVMQVLNGAGNALAGALGFDLGNTRLTYTLESALSESHNRVRVTYTVFDQYGNRSTGGYQFDIDATGPVAPPELSLADVNVGNRLSVPVSGRAEPGSTVTLSVDDDNDPDKPARPAVTRTAPANATTGVFSTTMNLDSLNDGVLTLQAWAVDGATNVGSTRTVTATKDTVAPTVSSATIAPDPITAATGTVVTITGAAEPGSTVYATVDDATPGNPVSATPVRAAAGTGAYSMQVDVAPLGDATITASVWAVDAATNTGAARTATAVKDAGVPNAPSVTITPATINEDTQGAVVVSGTAEPGATIAVSVDDANPATAARTGGTTAAAGTGAYSVTVDVTALDPDTLLTARVTAQDAVGNTSTAGTATARKDAVDPTAPDLVVPSYVNLDNQGKVPVSGTAEPDADVTVVFTGGTTTRTVTATANAIGDWSTTANLATLPQGAVTVAARARDAALNQSTEIFRSTHKDTVVPAPPQSVTLAPDPIRPASQAAVTISGTAEPGTRIDVTVDDTDAATPTVQADTQAAAGSGAWTVTVDVGNLQDGTLTAGATATDTAGNVSSPATDTAAKDTTALAITRTSPADGTIVTSPGTVSVTFNEPVTSASTLVVRDRTGSSLAGSRVLSTDKRTLVFTPSAPLAQGGSPYVAEVSALDAAGDQTSGTFGFDIDNVAPATLTAQMTQAVNSGNVGAVQVWGTTEADARVLVRIVEDVAEPSVLALEQTVAADAAGAYQATFNLGTFAEGPIRATVVASDVAGNQTAPATATGTKDTIAPAAPGLVSPAHVTSANVERVALSGSVGAGTVSVAITATDGTTTVPATPATATPDDGAWVEELDVSGLGEGTITFRVVATDGAGNDSTAVTSTALKDTTPPATPTGTIPDPVTAANRGAVVVSGTTTPGADVTVTLADADPATESLSQSDSADGQGAYSVTFDAGPLSDGELRASVVAADSLGNTTAPLVLVSTLDTTAPAVPTVALPDPITRLDQSVTVTGRTDPGALVALTVTDGGTGAVTGSDTADGTGDWSVTLDPSSLADGTLTASATAADDVGNVSAAGTDTAVKNVTRAFTVTIGTATPVSGTPYEVTVTAHRTFDPASPVDSAYTGVPTLAATGDTHFTGACPAAVAGEAKCAGVIFGDLGPATLTASDGTGGSGGRAVVVQPTAIAFSVAPPTTVEAGQPLSLTVVPIAGVSGAAVTDYAATRTLSVTGGGSTPGSGTPLACPAAACSFSVTFQTGGAKQIAVTDASTPSRSTGSYSVLVTVPMRLTLATSLSPVATGDTRLRTVLLSGRLSRQIDGSAVGLVEIRIYAKVAPGTTYRLVRRMTTAADGSYRATVGVDRNTVFQTVFLPESGSQLRRADSALRSVSVPTVIVVRSPASRSSLPAGSTVRVSGYTKPAKPGSLIYLMQRRADGSRVVLQRVRVASDGTYRFARSGLPRGTYQLYVLIGGGAVNSAGTSQYLHVKLG